MLGVCEGFPVLLSSLGATSSDHCMLRIDVVTTHGPRSGPQVAVGMCLIALSYS